MDRSSPLQAADFNPMQVETGAKDEADSIR